MADLGEALPAGDPRGTALLERRCRRLLVAYPAAYRADRGDEIVATMLDLTGPDRRSPRLADAADLVASGLRRRLGTAALAGFDAGLTVAAPVALALAAGISAFAWWRVEPISVGIHMGGPALFGVFRTLGPIAYLLWLIAAAGRALLRPSVGRVLIGVAVVVTLLLPVIAPFTTVDRPPLWVLMALSTFGLLALAGTGTWAGASATPSADERLGVPTGALAVAISASSVMVIWPPSGGGFGYYYQPTIARVGTVVAATVAVLAVIAVDRLLRGRSAQEWLWATALLGLPAGWLGPFDTAALRLAGDSAVPHFGRLAQVLLASCVATVAIVWLAQRRTPGSPPARVPGPRSLALAGAVTLGVSIGLTAFVLLGRLGALGFAGAAALPRYVLPRDGLPGDGLPGHVTATLAILLLAALCAMLPGRWAGRASLVALACGTGGSFLAGWLVAAYDNGWTLGGWTDFAHTTGLIATLAFPPLSLCAVVAARVLAVGAGLDRSTKRAAVAVLVVCVSWVGYVTVPYVLSWGPVLLVLIACCAALALSGRARPGSAPAP